jgi:hypothetical protein
MLIGFLLRRAVTLLLCAGSFWLGLKADRPGQARSRGGGHGRLPGGVR